MKPDIGSESRFLPTHLHSTPLLGGAKTRMVWLPDGEKNLEDMFIRFDMIHERDGHTQRQTQTDTA